MVENFIEIFKDQSKLEPDYVPEELVGREGEYRELVRLFKPVLEDGASQRLLVHGPGGSGKTALALRFGEDLERAAERSSVVLVYRLVLNEVVNFQVEDIKTKDLLILDEPTDGFSSTQLDKIRDILDDLSIRQTIIVSHEPKLESYVDNVINVYKERGVSRVEH